MARHLPAAERFYERWGWAAVVVARFIPWVRTFTPIVAGVARMSYPRFGSANAVGALLWAVGLVVLGHWAYSVPWLRYAAYVVAGVAVLSSVVGSVLGHHLPRRPADVGGVDPRRSKAEVLADLDGRKQGPVTAEPVDIVLREPCIGDRALRRLGHQGHGCLVGYSAAVGQRRADDRYPVR